MGCGWTARTDFARIPAIEAINGVNAEGPLSGIPFWEARLNAGLHITALGGSDNHDASLSGLRGIGTPTTVVWAENLGQDAILDGIRKGRVFVDVQGTRDRLLDVKAHGGRLSVHVAKAAGAKLTFAGPGAAGLSDDAALGEDDTRTFDLTGRQGWLRVDVRGPDGRLWLLGNPVYLN